MNTLPPPCPECAPFGGSFMRTESGLTRCACPRGQALRQAAVPKTTREVAPVISSGAAAICVEMLAALNYFPPEAGARSLIGAELRAMCSSEEDARWVVRRMAQLYSKWPGILEMRRVYCNGRNPHDGVEAVGISEVYPDGIPSEKLATPDARRLLPAPSDQISAAKSIEATVRDLAIAKDLNRIGCPAKVRDIPINRITHENRITEADVRQAEDEYRTAKARALLVGDPPIEGSDDSAGAPREGTAVLHEHVDSRPTGRPGTEAAS
jgi:hypothetical protein